MGRSDPRDAPTPQQNPTHATLQSIAERANVHVSTVSRALDPHPTRKVSAETVSKVRAIAKELGFNPNPWAQSLRTNRTKTLGLVIPRLVDNVLAVVFESAEFAALRMGYQAITVSTGDDPARTRNAIRVLTERRVDGLVLATARINDPIIDDLSARNIPFVLLNRSNNDHPTVRADDELGGYLATRHLLERGHARIAHVAGVEGTSTAEGRRAGYRQALAEAGITEDDELIRYSELGIDGGIAWGKALLAAENRPTAIFASNDYIAIGLMAAARDLGLRIPDDVAIVGYNDTRIGEALPVPLTSVSIPLPTMGSHAVETLIDLVEGRPVKSELFLPDLHIRASSAARRGPSLVTAGDDG
ncbi:MAG: LacI family transcriptional regulator [Microbacteriaceae bacterium]|nr:MAG: LacI family transcriptional regulator [Microbacteriaceae bacterium]